MNASLLSDGTKASVQVAARRAKATDLMTDGLRRLRCWCVRSMFIRSIVQMKMSLLQRQMSMCMHEEVEVQNEKEQGRKHVAWIKEKRKIPLCETPVCGK